MKLKVNAKLDPGFAPLSVICRDMREATKDNGQDIIIAIERNKGSTTTYKTRVFSDGTGHDEENFEFIERITKALLWISGIMTLIAGRKTEKKEGSYTTYLFEKGIDKILKKVGEEATEVIIAGKANDKKETIYEIADLAYHVMVLMIEMGISLEDIFDELASRHVIDHKVKQEKMTK